MKILALDMSSTKIGLCYDGTEFRTITLIGDIALRCELAHRLITNYLNGWQDIDLVAIESPVGRFTKAIIPQARVSGAILGELSRRELAWIEIAPAEAKKALTGKGNAKKPQMIAAAPAGCDEHQADAYGLWKAAQGKRVEVSR